MAARGHDLHVVVVVGRAIRAHNRGIKRVHLRDTDGVSRTQGDLGVVGGPIKEGTPHAREPILQVSAEGLGHGRLRKQNFFSLEEQADLHHEMRARPVPGQVHGDLELRRREEAVGAAGLPVEVVSHTRGADQVGVARGSRWGGGEDLDI